VQSGLRDQSSNGRGHPRGCRSTPGSQIEYHRGRDQNYPTTIPRKNLFIGRLLPLQYHGGKYISSRHVDAADSACRGRHGILARSLSLTRLSQNRCRPTISHPLPRIWSKIPRSYKHAWAAPPPAVPEESNTWSGDRGDHSSSYAPVPRCAGRWLTVWTGAANSGPGYLPGGLLPLCHGIDCGPHRER